MVELVRALSYDVDFQRELKQGQKFTVLLEQLVTSDGRVTHPGRLLAGELRLLKRTVTVIRFRPQGGAEGFYSPQGESVVRSFLRTPMDASKITSHFGMREHPILGFSALHAGVDFAAPPGTPILAAGTGKVVMAGPNGGYGNYVKLQHTSDVATAYAPALRIHSRRQAGQSVGAEVRHARRGRRQGRRALPGAGAAISQPDEERAGRGRHQASQAQGAGRTAGREGRLTAPPQRACPRARTSISNIPTCASRPELWNAEGRNK